MAERQNEYSIIDKLLNENWDLTDILTDEKIKNLKLEQELEKAKEDNAWFSNFVETTKELDDAREKLAAAENTMGDKQNDLEYANVRIKQLKNLLCDVREYLVDIPDDLITAKEHELIDAIDRINENNKMRY